MLRKWIALVLLPATMAALGLPAAALEVRFHPGERVYLFEDEADRQLYTAVLQNVAFFNETSRTIELQAARIEVRAGGQAVQTVLVAEPELAAAAARMEGLKAQGALELFDFHFQTSRYLGEEVRFGSTTTLAPGGALVLTGKALLLDGLAEEIVVVAFGRDPAGKAVEGRGSLRVVRHKSPNDYIFPMGGTVWIAAAPDFHSHHRWAANQEFALDVVTFGAEGSLFRGEGDRAEDYYGFGQEILAIGDGVVVEVEGGRPESAIIKRSAEESEESFLRRSRERQMKLLQQSPKAALGNYVVIRHPGEEYSNYLHLKAGSVRLEVGDRVKRGQVIGALGQSGNSEGPHLHFQMTGGPDPLYSRGLPVRFSNVMHEFLKVEGRHLHTGLILTAKN